MELREIIKKVLHEQGRGGTSTQKVVLNPLRAVHQIPLILQHQSR